MEIYLCIPHLILSILLKRNSISIRFLNKIKSIELQIIVLISFLIVLGHFGRAQEEKMPLFYNLGEDELMGVEIYDVLYTKDNILFAATSNGLYSIKNEKILRIDSAPYQKGNSIFSLEEGENGSIYFGNLSGQLFEYKKNQIELIHTFKKDALGYSFQLKFIGKNKLVFCSKKIIRFDLKKNKEEIIKFENQPLEYGKFSQTRISDTSVVIPFNINGLRTIVITPNSTIFKEILPNKTNYFYPKYVTISNHSYIIDLQGTLIDAENGKTLTKLNYGSQSLSTELGRTFYSDPTRGIYELARKKDEIALKTVFKSNAIASFDFSRRSPLILGTFGAGIIVIPNLQITTLLSQSLQTKIVDFVLSGDTVYFSTLEGKIYESSSKKSKIILNDLHSRLDNLYLIPNANNQFGTLPKTDLLIFNNPSRSYDFKDLAQVKNHIIIDTNKIAFAAYMGLTIYSDTPITAPGFVKFPLTSSILSKKYNYKYVFLSKYNLKRGQALAYSHEKQEMYYGCAEGLFSFNSAFENREILYKGKKIRVNDLKIQENKLLIGTDNEGILVFEGGKVASMKKVNDALSSQIIKQFEFSDKQFIVSTAKYLHIFDHKYSPITYLGPSDGIGNNSVTKFFLKENDLIFLSYGRIYQFKGRKKKQLETIPKLTLDSIFFGSQKVNISELSRLPFTSNSFTAHYHCYDLEKYKRIRIQYRILGLDPEWKEAPMSQSPIKIHYLPFGAYKFEIRLLYNDLVKSTKEFRFEIEKPLYLRTGFLIMLILLFLVLVFALYKWRINVLEKKNRKKFEIQKIKYDALDSKLKSLRSQMNPHFIFNSLNSIQSLILNQETDKSLDYVAIFSSLVRKTLNYSDNNFLLIEEEIEFLTLYLELESLRMPEEFSYSFHNNAPLATNIPSMLIQPFVENSIHHGLLHKSGAKHIDISFDLSDDETFLRCIVEDNGVGRKAAKKYNISSHDSFSLKAIKQRIDVLGQKYKKSANYQVEDLYLGEEPKGTRVTIMIPANIL